jgi:diguanylate cyclase (GGDEF)-like protein/PAS domain S-box-containing protein
MARAEPLRILLVEDDEDDFVLTRSMLQAPGPSSIELEWESTYSRALRAIREARHDLYLVDYRLGERNGLDLVRDAWEKAPAAPVIVLTGQDDHTVDLQATALGVTDYLVKGTLDASSLERTIRYAVRHHEMTEELRRSEERYAVAIQATNDGIWDWDLSASAMHVSDRWTALLGYEDASAFDRPEAWFALVHPDDVDPLRRDIKRHLEGRTPHFESEHRMRHADRRWRWVLSRGLATRDANGAPVRITGSLSDTTERRVAQERLLHDALHDALTGLANRTLFTDRLGQSLARLSRDPGHACAVVYIDVDRFKLVNDSLSHAAGDRLLIELARRIGHVLRPGDTLARLGGDEFGILLDGDVEPASSLRIAERVAEAIAEPVRFDHRVLTVTASIGIAHNLDGVTAPDELIRNADIAMYDAKARGGGEAAVFDAGMHQRVVARVALETRLRQAIDEGLLRTFFQPIVDLRSGGLHGFEALARWPEGDEPPIPPVEFIAVAEESGLIGSLGRLVLHTACAALAGWRHRSLVGEDVTVAVNISVRHVLSGGLLSHVREALRSAGLPARNLVLEITESTLIENPELVRSVLTSLVDLGVTVQIDDFGTGYSSLTVLHEFPGDTLKIDRSFVATMDDRPESATIVRSIVGLAHNLGLRVVAEGIERPDQRDVLESLGCEYGQGYLFARPLAAADAEALLRDGLATAS